MARPAQLGLHQLAAGQFRRAPSQRFHAGQDIRCRQIKKAGSRNPPRFLRASRTFKINMRLELAQAAGRLEILHIDRDLHLFFTNRVIQVAFDV
jgi:hypothetical protein